MYMYFILIKTVERPQKTNSTAFIHFLICTHSTNTIYRQLTNKEGLKRKGTMASPTFLFPCHEFLH